MNSPEEKAKPMITLSKEDVLKKEVGKSLTIDSNDSHWHVKWWMLLDPSPSIRRIYGAMDEYAKQECIAMIKWINQNNEGTLCVLLEDGTCPETEEEIYELYKKNK